MICKNSRLVTIFKRLSLIFITRSVLFYRQIKRNSNLQLVENQLCYKFIFVNEHFGFLSLNH
jgi:hypothetical protein